MARLAHDIGSGMSIELVAGLGNPGERYSDSRHNTGFLVVDELASRHATDSWVQRRFCDLTSAWLGPRMVLAKPTRFMNRSGEALSWALDHLGIRPEQMLVVLDDIELDLGTLRLRRAGGPGTHNGLRDIYDRIGPDFPRLRIGVRGASAWDDLAEYVLSPFDEAELVTVRRVVKVATDAVECAVLDGIDVAMSRFNGPLQQAPDV